MVTGLERDMEILLRRAVTALESIAASLELLATTIYEARSSCECGQFALAEYGRYCPSCKPQKGGES